MRDKQNKKCSKCKTTKPRTQFYKRNNANSKSIIVHAKCIECMKQDGQKKRKDICKCGKNKTLNAKECIQCIIAAAKDFTIGDKTYDKHKYAKYSYVRYYAGNVAKAENFCKCERCGYDKHFEVCHIRAISNFPSDTLISVINHPDNLIPLCPNCHWEFDRGLWKLDEVRPSRLELELPC